MNEEKRVRFLRELQELAAKEGISFEDLLDKAELGELVLKFWEESGEKKEPDEVIHRPDIAELVKEIQQLWGNLQ
jgi:hypothetical protein